jgi:hypothetical protein
LLLALGQGLDLGRAGDGLWGLFDFVEELDDPAGDLA